MNDGLRFGWGHDQIGDHWTGFGEFRIASRSHARSFTSHERCRYGDETRTTIEV